MPEAQIQKFRQVAGDGDVMRRLADKVFGSVGLGEVAELNLIDGLRLIFNSGAVVHLRPSNNAPQFRVYTNASSQTHADQLALSALAPDGYIMNLLAELGD